ncbi:MAG: peptidylprolyl isomerase [Actinomycetota bacterium]|nr:peptidylprolyl isomerase [Actinomycetota bacterium]
MRVAIASLLAVATLALPACGADSDDGSPAPEGPCEAAETPAAKDVILDPPPSRPQAQKKLTAIVETSCGTIEIALDTKGSPKTTASFAYLAVNGVYDNTAWHRIALAPPVIQGGDPTGDGTGGPGYSIDEPPPAGTAYTRGVVAMAKTEVEPPGRSGSQFFIVTAADAGLPPIYALLGKVTKGLDVVETISQYGDPTGQTEDPLEPVVIESVTVEKG